MTHETLWTVSLTQSDVEKFPNLANHIATLTFKLPVAQITVNVDTGAMSIAVTEADFAMAKPVIDELRIKVDSLVRRQQEAEEQIPAGTAAEFDFDEYCEEH